MMNVTFKLSKPIIVHGDEVNELSLREPTTEDYIKYGNPTVISMDGASFSMSNKVLANYMVALAGIPMSSVTSMAVTDVVALGNVIVSFFSPSGD